ncbi:MAG: GNAT family N-acetyltransferase [Turicibacter sp.]
MIHLEPINASNYKECCRLKVSETQKDFVGENAESLAKAYVFYDTVTPLAIYWEKQMIGFILIRFNPSNQNYFLWEFMIDSAHQSKGYGRLALNSLIQYIKYKEDSRSIVTTYKMENEWAKKLYESAGFEFLDICEEENEVNLILQLNKGE